MRTARRRLAFLGAASAVALGWLPGCNEEINMATQPHYLPLQASAFFADGAAARALVEGTMSRQGVLFSSAPSAGPAAKPPLTAELLARGQERFNIYCSPCHGRDGFGRGMVVERGYPAPPTYHEPRLRGVSDEHIYSVISIGLGKMPPYGKNVRPEERWAIIAYVRALQLSQNARWEDVPDSARDQLANTEGGTP